MFYDDVVEIYGVYSRQASQIVDTNVSHYVSKADTNVSHSVS